MVHSVTIWNDILELQRKNENRDVKLCILTLFETYMIANTPLDPLVKAVLEHHSNMQSYHNINIPIYWS